MPPNEQQNFSFAISLSVLEHLGRHLYRSFATVLGEAISNAWDADAKNVWINIDRDNLTLLIKDDGIGMTSDDFQNKFLKIGYSKRKEGESKSSLGRPYIGRKGIGKLALLSCADKIAVISKTRTTEYIGGVIDNGGLDLAIRNDQTPDQYALESLDSQVFGNLTHGHEHGTIIKFDGFKDGIRNTTDHLKKTIALYFRFSLLDPSFNIHVDDKLVDANCLRDLMEHTQFLWRINESTDPYLSDLVDSLIAKDNENRPLKTDPRIYGFIASVRKPSERKIRGTDEAVTVDLLVNGRLRERDILKHIPTARVVESYLYGQIHFNELDDEEDRFTSSRESIVANDPKFAWLLERVNQEILRVILGEWDDLRRKHKKDGDSENTAISKKERKSEELFNIVAEEYRYVDDDQPENADKVEVWIDSLGDDAKFNFASYAECFMAENLIRKYIEGEAIPLSKEAEGQVEEYKKRERDSKSAGNVSIEVRRNTANPSYLAMAELANLVDKTTENNNLPADSKQYKPIRDALMHTALLSDPAKLKLTTVFQNIQARVKTLLVSGGQK